jgi:hypothetical protein
MVFLTKLGFDHLEKQKNFQGLDDDFGLKRPNHHLGPEYVHLFKAKKYGMWEDF